MQHHAIVRIRASAWICIWILRWCGVRCSCLLWTTLCDHHLSIEWDSFTGRMIVISFACMYLCAVCTIKPIHSKTMAALLLFGSATTFKQNAKRLNPVLFHVLHLSVWAGHATYIHTIHRSSARFGLALFYIIFYILFYFNQFIAGENYDQCCICVLMFIIFSWYVYVCCKHS